MDDERSGTEDTGSAGHPAPALASAGDRFLGRPLPAFFVLSDRRQFLSQIFIYGLFALSLDLILGYAGILSLGHAAFFGVGAYTAGLLARHGWAEPLSGLGAAAIVAGAFGYAVSFLVVPGADLTRLMVTLGIGLLTVRGGESGVVDHRRRRRARRHATSHAVRQALVRSRRHDGMSLQPRDPGAGVRAGAADRSFAVRSVAAWDPRERATHARHRHGCSPSATHGLRAVGRDGRRGRRVCLRRPRDSSASTRSASSARPSCSSSWRSAAPGACMARCLVRRCSWWRRTRWPASAPPTGSSGSAPCWSSWCCLAPGGLMGGLERSHRQLARRLARRGWPIL